MNSPTQTTSSSPHHLYIASKQADIYHTFFQQQCLPNVVLTDDKSQATIVLGDPPQMAAQLEHFPNLIWLQATYAGVDTLVQELVRKDYQLTNVKGIFGQLISEYVLGYSLSYLRHFGCYQQQQQIKQWQPHPYNTVKGKTMVILGTGSIGNQLARAVSALGFIAVGVNRSGQAPDNNAFHHIYSIAQLDRALAQADVVVNALPNTPQTDKLLSHSAFQHCHGALFFNIGRGHTLDEPALLAALDCGQISHAFLDVFREEPLSQDSPLWLHPNITITPHIAANSFPEQVWDIFTENYHLFDQQQALKNVIDFELGY
ncbi:D-2-hydroxyacid dehydrogenase [Vibrio sp. S11_S32]|uniref:D-2-hydroxyacid dehydrogenase n=1 Tax=Vibrio sp. S11_S32 TaxID=2720225 RepID=UPI001681493D|nr:D-2-hydroxyacid dehydrogenase [Vibrio sp. S11_S32]MBD1575826.1 D-2-hydroxyacid dehydrogenase [Vibrio sp. S11_S32]